MNLQRERVGRRVEFYRGYALALRQYFVFQAYGRGWTADRATISIGGVFSFDRSLILVPPLPIQTSAFRVTRFSSKRD